MYASHENTGATFLDIDQDGMCDKDSKLPHMLPDHDVLARAAYDTLGVRSDRPVVLYSKPPFTASARAWWMLRTLGKEDVYVLNGGLDAWKAEGNKVEQSTDGLPNPAQTSSSEQDDKVPIPPTKTPGVRSKLLRTLSDMLQIIHNDSGVIIDARPEARFSGTVSEPRSGLRGGHMPGAINIPSSSVVSADGFLKEREQLIDVFEHRGLSLDSLANKDISVSCGSGVTAAIVALALHELGIDAAVYDGSWVEYGDSSKSHPVVTST